MNDFLDNIGLKRLVENIKSKFQKKKLHCELWDDGGDWTITFRDTMEEAVIETEYAKIFDRIKNNENNLIFDVLSNGIEIINNHYNVDYEINYSSNTKIIIVFHFIDGAADHDVSYSAPIKISLDIDKDTNSGEIFIFKGEEYPDITSLYKVNYIKHSFDNSNKVLTGNLGYDIVPKVIEIDIDNEYIITPDGNRYKLEQTSSFLYNKLKVLYDTKCPIQILITSNNGKVIANNTYIYYSNNTIRLEFSYNRINIDWEELPKLRVTRLKNPQVIGTIYITSTGSNTYELIEENTKLIGGSCNINLYEDEPKTISFSDSNGSICFDKDDSNYVAGNALKIIENFRRINIMNQNNGVNFSIYGLDSIYDIIQSDNNNVLVNYFMSGDDDNLHNYTFVIFTHEINESNQNSPTPCIYYFNLFIDSNDPDNSITYEIKNLYYTTPIPLTDRGDGTKFLANDGKYKEVKGYDKVYYGSYDYFATDGGGASQKIRDEAKELLLAGKNVIIYDDSVGALYNVGYIDDDEFIFKISGYNPQLGYILIDIVDFGDIYANNIIKIFSEKGYGNKFLADDGSYVHTSKLITFEAENGSLDAKQKEDIDEGYNRNLPMYVLYSGIKMLVNSIQKLGDVWSLSCRHEGVVYSVTVDTAEMSYNVITNV